MKEKQPLQPEIDHLFSNSETWEPWESKLVGYSIIIGIVSLIVLAVIVNILFL